MFPLSRTWTLKSGSLPGRIDVRCVSDGSLDYEYTWSSGDQTIETGIFQVAPNVKPLPTIDMRPRSGAARLGVYDIVGDSMELALGAPGAARPPSLAGASTYTTR